MSDYPKLRSDYRTMTDRELLDEVKQALNPNWQELAIVLAERWQVAWWESKHYCARCSEEI